MLAELQRNILTAPSSDFWQLTIFGLVVAIVLWFFGFRNSRRARLIEDVPTSRVRSAAQGYVELIGHAEMLEGPKVIAPLTGLPCVWFKYRIEERRRSGKNTNWRTIDKGRSDAIFLFKDDTGHCVIDPDGADVTVREKKQWFGSTARPLRSEGEKKGVLQFLTSGRYRYTEWRLEEYDHIYAIGWFKTTGGGNEHIQTLGEEARDLIAKWKNDPKILARFDDNKDGKIDMDEWEALRKAAHQEVIKIRGEQTELPAMHVLQKPVDKRPYLLSAEDPEKMVKKYRWSGRFMLIVTVLLTSLCLYAINVRLDLA